MSCFDRSDISFPLEVVGKHALAGVSAGVDTLAEVVLGQEKKHETYHKVGETVGAFQTIARSVVGSPENIQSEDEAYRHKYFLSNFIFPINRMV